MRDNHHLGHRGRNVFGIFAMTRGQLLRAYMAAKNAGLTATEARLERRLADQREYYAHQDRLIKELMDA